MVKIGGVTVLEDGSVRWGALLSVLLGAPVLAAQNEILRTMQAWSRGVGDAVAAARETVVETIDVVLGGTANAAWRAQDAFVSALPTETTLPVGLPIGMIPGVPGASSMTLDMGPFAFAAAVLVALLTMAAFTQGLRTAWGGLRG